MNIELVPVQETEKSVLRQMIELYEYDLSIYTQEDINQHGFYGYSYFDYYWTENNRYAYFIKSDNILCGFVLVNDYCYALEDDTAKSISEFFIMKKYRRFGIGKKIAFEIFDLFHGEWEVDQIPGNDISYKFWENIISEYTNGIYKKSIVDTEDGEKQAIIFSNKK